MGCRLSTILHFRLRGPKKQGVKGEGVVNIFDKALLLSCPSDDLASLLVVIGENGAALVPAGGAGDLEGALGVGTLYLVEVGADGPHPAAAWRAELRPMTPLTDPDPRALLPASWVARHPDAYSMARRPVAVGDNLTEDASWDDDEPAPQQVFVPITNLEQLPKHRWLFTNELVPKQQRGGRRFAPRVPTLVQLVD